MMEIYAHRGASGYAPENTIESFALAADMGADGVELDAQMTKDGELVVAHDEDIDRVSNGSGKIRDMTLEELKAFSFGRAMSGYESARIPTLKEVFTLLKPRGLGINVELKTGVVAYPGIERKCVELAADMGMTGKVQYSSFNHESLRNIKAIDRTLPCGLLYQRTPRAPWNKVAGLGMEAVNPQFRALRRKGFCALAHAAGIRVNPWTVNGEDDLKLVMAAGADMIITNYPDRAIAVRRALNAATILPQPD
jgi:glycerophosphoryl diester phosphodiesterase